MSTRKTIRWVLLVLLVVYNIIGASQILSDGVYEGIDEFLYDISFPFWFLAAFVAYGLGIDSFGVYFVLQAIVFALFAGLIYFFTREKKEKMLE